MRNTLAIVAAALVCAVSLPVSAQEFRGSILGRITDPSGAVIPGSKIQVINQETGVQVSGESNSEGNYNMPFLLPGTYTVSVISDGFKQANRPNIIVQVNDRITLDFALQVGAAAESVTVTAETPLLQTANAELGQVVDRKMIDRLPMSGMNAINLVDMAPGVRGGSGNQIANGQNDIVINGGSGTIRGNDITVDGIPNVAPRFNGLAVTVPTHDAVQEFKVQTTLFDASSGRSNGGALSFSTRSGTNNLHGTAYYFFYDEALNANGWTRNRASQRRDPVNEYLFGGTVGGPVYIPKLYDGRNKSFFFGSYEKSHKENAFSRFARVPTELERNGDFSQTLALRTGRLELYDPFSTVSSGANATRTPFPNATIPQSRLNPMGRAVLNLYPKPTDGTPPRIGVFNWTGNGKFKGDLENTMLRFDQVISAKQRLYLRYSQLDALDTRDPLSIEGAYDVPSSATGRASENINPRYNKSAAVDDSYSFAPTLFASFRYGYTRTYLYEYFDGNRRDASAMSVPDVILHSQASGGYPILRMNELMPYYGSKVRTSVNDTHSLYTTFNHLRGRHTIKFGTDMRVIRWNENNPGEAQNGRFEFNNQFTRADPTRSATADTSGTSMASLLLGLPANGDLGYISALSLQSWYTAAFIQDDIRLHPSFTLNLGLRYELETPATERFDRIGYGFDENVKLDVNVPGMDLRGGLQFVNASGLPRRQGRLDLNNFGPRISFAWTPTSRWVIRGGYGMFYSSALSNMGGTNSVNTSALGAQPSFNAVTRFQATDNDGRTPLHTLANPFPNGLVTPTGASLGSLSELGNSVAFANPDRVLPYVQQWQMSFQRELPWQSVVEAAYVGSHSLKLLDSFNLNERPDRYLAEGARASESIPNPFYRIFPVTSTLGASANTTRSRFWVQYPQFSQVTVHGVNSGRALYHSAQLRVQKRMTNGLSFVGNYTWSKSLYYDMFSVVNERDFRGVPDLDRPHMFRLFTSYSFPVGRGRALLGSMPRWADTVVGGWELSGSYRYTSGAPLSVTDGSRGRPIPVRNPVLSGPVGSRLGDQRDASGRPVNPYFDTTVWQRVPDDFTLSFEPLNLDWLRGPAGTYTSLVLYKVFQVKEGMRLELRGEANNWMNTPQFNSPSTDIQNPSTFGTITGAGGIRNMNISLKLRF